MTRLLQKRIWAGIVLSATIALVLAGVRARATATVVVVKPSAMNGWFFLDDQTNSTATATGFFTTGPGAAPAGTGSAHLPLTGATDGQAIVLPGYAGTLLSSITHLSYSTYRSSVDAGNNLAIALQFPIDFVADANVAYQGRLVFEPYQAAGGTVVQGVWQPWDALNGKWWATNLAASGGLCPQASPCTWAQVLLNWPTASIHSVFGAFIFKAGSGWSVFDGNVDEFRIVAGASDTTYDFEAETGCTTDCYVDVASGNDSFGGDSFLSAKKTIQAAVNQVTVGGTVHVAIGTYPELVTINRAMTLKGAQFGVDGRNVGRTGLPATESVATGNAGTTAFYVTGSGVTIDGFTVQGNTIDNQFGFGILLGAGTHASRVVNNIVQDNVAGISLANNSAVPAEQTLIQYNHIRNNNQPGAATGTGIYTDQYNGGGTVQNVVIDNNLFSGNGGNGVGDGAIDFSSTDGAKPAQEITISNNTFDGNRRGLFALNMLNSVIFNNTFKNSLDSGTADIRLLEGANGVTVTYNVLQNGAGRAMRISNEGYSPVPDAANVLFNRNSITGYTGPSGIVQVESPGYAGTMDGTCNWWGAANGPSGAGPGSGSSVSLNVTFSPWLYTSNLAGPCADKPTVLSVIMVPSSGTYGQNVTVKSDASDPTGLTDIYYNLFTPGGAFVCNLAHVVVPGSPTFDSDSTPVSVPMPFAGLDTGVGGPCPVGGIAPGNYVLTANWFNAAGIQVGDPDNQNLGSYPAAAKFSPVTYIAPAPAITIVKKTNGTDNNATPGLSVATGSLLTFTYNITNTGNVTLTGVSLVDDVLGAIPSTFCSPNTTTLIAGASTTCTKTATAVVGTHKNVGTVTGTPPVGNAVTANDSEWYTGQPACESVPPSVSLSSQLVGPPKKVILKAQDAGGIQSIVTSTATNIVLPVQYSVNASGIPATATFTVGTTAPVYIIATKANQNLTSVIGVTVKDKCGNTTVYDPFDVTVNPGKRQALTVEDVAGDETLALIVNDDLNAMRITVNGHEIMVRNLKDHETRVVNMAQWMVPGNNNTLTFEARGPKNSSAIVTVYPPGTGATVLTTSDGERRHKRTHLVDLFD